MLPIYIGIDSPAALPWTSKETLATTIAFVTEAESVPF